MQIGNFEDVDDYSNQKGLGIYYKIMRIRALPIPGAERLAALIAKLLPYPKPSGLCIVKTIHGFNLMVDPILDKGVEKSIFLNGTYEYGTMKLLEEILAEEGIFIDVGANIGLMSLHAAKILNGRGKVLSFEPLPNTYNMLLQNIALNNIENIKAENIAIGNTQGSVEIFENLAINRGASSLISPDQNAAGHKVRVMPLDTYLKEQQINNVICIKIDVEGWELEVLKGSIRTLSGEDAPCCIIEYSLSHATHGGDAEDIYNFLCEVNSYRIFRLARGKEFQSKLLEIKHKEDLPTHDNLICLLPNHIQRLPTGLFN